MVVYLIQLSEDLFVLFIRALIDVRIFHFSSRIKVCNLWFVFFFNVSKMDTKLLR